MLPVYLHYPSSSRPNFCVGWDTPLSIILLRPFPKAHDHEYVESQATCLTCLLCPIYNVFKFEINKSMNLPTLKLSLACLWKKCVTQWRCRMCILVMLCLYLLLCCVLYIYENKITKWAYNITMLCVHNFLNNGDL